MCSLVWSHALSTLAPLCSLSSATSLRRTSRKTAAPHFAFTTQIDLPRRTEQHSVYRLNAGPDGIRQPPNMWLHLPHQEQSHISSETARRSSDVVLAKLLQSIDSQEHALSVQSFNELVASDSCPGDAICELLLKGDFVCDVFMTLKDNVIRGSNGEMRYCLIAALCRDANQFSAAWHVFLVAKAQGAVLRYAARMARSLWLACKLQKGMYHCHRTVYAVSQPGIYEPQVFCAPSNVDHSNQGGCCHRFCLTRCGDVIGYA